MQKCHSVQTVTWINIVILLDSVVRPRRSTSWMQPTATDGVLLLPAALRAAQTCRYFVYSEADFEVFHPAGATRCTDGGVKFGTGSPPPCQISPPSVQRQGCRTPKLKFLLRFDRNLEYKHPAGAYPLRDFHKICRVCTSFQDALGVKMWLDLLKALWSYGGFKLMVSGCCQIFSGP